MKHLALICLILTTITYAVEDIRFCSIGMGTFGTVTAKLAVEKGFKMVAAFTRYSKHLKTVGELLDMESDESLSFHVSGMNKLEEVIDTTKPHFCIDATNSTLAGVFPHFRRLIAKGIHILTLSNEAVFPNTRFHWKPKQLYRALDTAAKQNNVVILGGGASDSILIPVIPSISASMMELHRVKVNTKMNIDRTNEKYCRTHGVGMTQNEFNEHVQSLTLDIGYWQRAVVEAIADSMGLPLLDVKDGAQHENIALYTRKECYEVQDDDGVYSNALNAVIRKGDCAGVNVTVLGRARDGIEIVFNWIMAVLPNEQETNNVDVVLNGVPDVEFSIQNVDWFVVTGASLLHRVPMVLNELSPGFHNVNDLKANKYWSKVGDWNRLKETNVEETLDTDKTDL
eukprot:46025_1